MQNYLDLDKLIPEDKKIILGGKEWTIPGSIPTESMLKMVAVGQKATKAGDKVDSGLIEETIQAYHSLFAIRQPDLSLDDFREMFDINVHASALSTFIFGQVETAEKKTE